MTLLTVKDLSVSIHEQPIIKNISFSLGAGEILALTGESGSGKSISALALMGLLPYGSKKKGLINFEGKDLNKISETNFCKLRGKKISMVFQEPMTALNPMQSIGKQISETLVQHKACAPNELKNRVRKTMDRVGLRDIDPSRFPHQLSGGQRQRVVIAMAICLEPSILIADEPTTALDVTTQSKILKLLQEFSEKDGISVILITHDLAIVANIANYLLLMKEGVLVDQGKPRQVFKDLSHPYTKKLFSASRQRFSFKENNLSEEKLLEVRSVSVNYKSHEKGVFSKGKSVVAVSDVSLDIKKGERLGLVGESGCGKSTLTRTILGLQPASSGYIKFDGKKISKYDNSFKKNIQVVFQDPYGSFNPRQKIGRLITEPFFTLGKEAPPKTKQRIIAEEMLKEVGLSSESTEKYIHEFSGGQRQRIAIARALVIKPKLIIFDEAVSALDVSIRSQILKLISDLTERYGLSYLFISHDLTVIENITENCLVMKNGKIVERGQTKHILRDPKNEYTLSLINAAPKFPNFLHA